MINNKVVHVFLRNKIIGIDTILPTCMEIHGRCGFKFKFISFDYLTYKAIVENNIVLRDAVNHIGTIELVSSDRYKSRYLSKIFFIFYFIKVIFSVVVKKNYIMHSSHLHAKPFVWIKWMFKKSNVIFIKSRPFDLKDKTELKNPKNHKLKKIYNKNMTYGEISKYGIDIYSHPPPLYAGILIGYDQEWNYFKHPKASRLNKIVFNNIRKGKYWINFVNNHATKYIENEMPSEIFKSGKILVFVATRITRKTDTNCIHEFVGALRALSKYTHTFPLFIKLHTFSDTDFIDELLSIALGEKNGTRYVFTKLHPAVLATKSIISVFSNSGMLMDEFSGLNVPVINLKINKDILPASYLGLSRCLPEDNLITRDEIRRKSSDRTFTDERKFDKFMEELTVASFNLDDTKSFIPSLEKTMSNLGPCDLSKE